MKLSESLARGYMSLHISEVAVFIMSITDSSNIVYVVTHREFNYTGQQ